MLEFLIKVSKLSDNKDQKNQLKNEKKQQVY
jgi:hypothetical protein